MVNKQNIKRNGILCLTTFLLMLNLSCGEEQKEITVEEEISEEPLETEETEAESWNYENTNWEEIEDTDCNTAVQSPVDINPDEAIPAKLPEIEYEYQPFELRIVDNGHTIQGSGTEDSFMTVGEKRYQFIQFHFHSPSEHTINGEAYPLEMHLVHQEVGTTNLAVVGIFIEEGIDNMLLENVFTNIPSEEKIEEQTDLTINLSDLIPPEQTYYTYIGSLTTPPCTVGVDWILYDEPIKASAEQIALFGESYQNTARPVQLLDNRRVYTTMK